MCSHEDALSKAIEILKKSNPHDLAENSRCKYDEQNRHFLLNYCRNTYQVSYPGGEVRQDSSNSVTVEERVLFLQYLVWSRGILPRREWVSFLELPGGEMHYAPFQRETFVPLVNKYGTKTDEFIKRGNIYGEAMPAGDAAFIIPVFPCIEMAIILWEGDAEYPARANVLFDVNSSCHLPTASLYVLGIEVVKRIYEI